VTGVGGVPTTGVSAVVLNATVPAPALKGHLQVYPLGAKPAVATSNVNWRPGRTQANAVTVAVGTGGKIGLMVDVGKADVALDVVGWYGDAPTPPATITTRRPRPGSWTPAPPVAAVRSPARRSAPWSSPATAGYRQPG